jgi:alanine racemase
MHKLSVSHIYCYNRVVARFRRSMDRMFPSEGNDAGSIPAGSTFFMFLVQDARIPTVMQNLPLAYIELSKENLAHNLTALRSLAKPGTRLAFAVKGNAYGHGLNEIVPMAEPYVDHFFVNSIEELRALRVLSQKPTFLFGYVAPELLGEVIGLGCTLGIFSKEQFVHADTAARALGVVADVHITCDSLLGRDGFLPSELPELFEAAKACPNVKISGMYSHFANIEDTTDFTHAQKQIDAYAEMRKIAEAAGYANLETHLSATSGLMVYESEMGANTIVRIGIGGYGLWPSEPLKRKYGKKGFELKPVLSWKTRVAQVKTLAKGMTIGYGLTHVTQKETKIALVPQGYADGYPRTLSNTGMTLIRGRRCAVLGRVSMNMFVVDATNVPEAQEGDEVVLIGEQGDKSISAQEVAERSGTINYEATTRISALLPRIVC